MEPPTGCTKSDFMKRIIERFHMKYMLTDVPGLGRPHALSDNDQTKITEHVYKNPGMSACHVTQELDHKHEMVRTMLKKERYFPYQISMLHKLKPEDYTPCYNYRD